MNQIRFIQLINRYHPAARVIRVVTVKPVTCDDRYVALVALGGQPVLLGTLYGLLRQITPAALRAVRAEQEQIVANISALLSITGDDKT